MSRFKWYRRLLGGTWYKVAMLSRLDQTDRYWTRKPSNPNMIIAKEVWM